MHLKQISPLESYRQSILPFRFHEEVKELSILWVYSFPISVNIPAENLLTFLIAIWNLFFHLTSELVKPT